MRALHVPIVLCLALIPASLPAQEKQPVPKVVFSPPLKRTGEGLATVSYQLLAEEEPFLAKVNEPEIDLWPPIPGGLPPLPEGTGKEKAKPSAPETPKPIPSSEYRLNRAEGKYAGWFGIVRKTSGTDGGPAWLVEHKYFDGLCDSHLQIVSLYGAGDFTVKIPSASKDVPVLSLVRLYGPVSKGKDGLPVLAPEFIRVWKQPLFTFMDYGEDHSNPKWTALRKVPRDETYSPSPDKNYYSARLGPEQK